MSSNGKRVGVEIYAATTKMGEKSEIQSSKFETSTKDQNPKFETGSGPALAFRSLEFWAWDLFRISGFVLRIPPLGGNGGQNGPEEAW
jgi:hypothetical protein